jgi:hypothetical protein
MPDDALFPPATDLARLAVAVDAIRHLIDGEPSLADTLPAMRAALGDPAALGVAGFTTSTYVAALDHDLADDALDPSDCRIHPLTAMLLQLGQINVSHADLHKHPWVEQVEDDAMLWVLAHDRDHAQPHVGNPWRHLAAVLADLAATTSPDQAIAALQQLLQATPSGPGPEDAPA